MSSRYQYTKLPSEGYFIHHMILQAGAFDDPIRFGLITTSIITAPPYEALSSVWGYSQQACLEAALVDGPTFSIALDLSTALCHLRNEPGVSEERLMWIDAICLYFDRYRTEYHRNLRC
ncbi:hypothetical protein DL98DRAFT_536154 [Cadophora sp. DSE1049]|nr:hypothetical protein DL98DRAFT_536154 [Cadophora sp. DSE1049]